MTSNLSATIPSGPAPLRARSLEQLLKLSATLTGFPAAGLLLRSAPGVWTIEHGALAAGWAEAVAAQGWMEARPGREALTGSLGAGRLRHYVLFPVEAAGGALSGLLALFHARPVTLSEELRCTLEALAAQAGATLEDLLGAAGAQIHSSLTPAQILLDLEGRLVWATPQFGRITGRETSNVRGQRLEDLAAPDSRPAARQMLIEAMGGGHGPPKELALLTRERGTVVCKVYAALVFERGRPRFLSVSAWDASELHRLRRALEASENRYESLAATVNEGILILDRSGRVAVCSRRAEQLLGYSLEQLRASGSLDPESRLVGWDGEPLAPQEHPGLLCLASGRPHTRALAGVSSPEGRRWLSLHAYPLHPDSPDPQAEAVLVAVSDVSDLVAARQAAGEQSAEIDRFSDDLAEIRRLDLGSYRTPAELLAAALRAGRRILRLPEGAVYQLAGGGLQLQASSVAEPGPACAEVVRWRRTLTHHDLPPGVHSGPPVWVETPLVDSGCVRGTLRFFDRNGDPARAFTARERGFLELLAGAVSRSTAIGNMEAERERSSQLEADRQRAVQLVAENQPLSAVLQHIAGLVERQHEGLSASVIVPAGDDGGHLVETSLGAGYEEAIRASLPEPRKLIETLLSEGGAPDSQPADRLPPFDRAPQLAVQLGIARTSLVALALAQSEPLGLLLVHERAGAEPGAARRALEVAAPLAALAIHVDRRRGGLAADVQRDALTGLWRRPALEQSLSAALGEPAGPDWMLALFFLDLDRLRSINDSLGHEVGDLVLVEVARRLNRWAAPGVTVARAGGDEFAILLPSVASEAEASEAAVELLDTLRAPMLVAGHELFLTASLGISFAPKDGAEASLLLRRADAAMSRVKSRGRNGHECFHSSLGDLEGERLKLENALRRALEGGEMELLYQPQVTLNGRLDGFEVLLSWRHPVLGKIAPGRFIPIAEEIGIIQSIGAWVLERACRQAAAWLSRGRAPVRVGVNVSPLQFAQAGFVELVAGILERTHLPGACLELEITESTILRDFDDAERRMRELRELGVLLAIDDFGIGYSSLNYLRRLPVDTVKIDCSFVEQVDKPNGTLPLIHTITILAHNLGLKVVAEGVETEEELELLAIARCDRAQGFLFGEPMPAPRISRLLAKGWRAGRKPAG